MQNTSISDNRNYVYGRDSVANREEYPIIANWVPSGSRVLDLGCGDGSLLELLRNKGVQGKGIEISDSGVRACRSKGLEVDAGRIDVPLNFRDQEFDFSLCNITLQMVMYPEVTLSEMKRISVHQILTFPNFAYFANRRELFFGGRMPRATIPGYQWYSTGHIHQFSIRDFQMFCAHNGMRILADHSLYPDTLLGISTNSPMLKWIRIVPNLFAREGIFLTSASFQKK